VDEWCGVLRMAAGVESVWSLTSTVLSASSLHNSITVRLCRQFGGR
jgi:hypothetical protein